MNFIAKATLQNTISWLPRSISDLLYFSIQRRFGGLKNFDPSTRIAAGLYICQLFRSFNLELRGMKVFELGSGRAPIIPLTLWLHGVSEVITVDLNPYLSPTIFNDTISWLRGQPNHFELFGNDVLHERLNILLSAPSFSTKTSLVNYLNSLGIRYMAPCDAADLPFPGNYFDAHISYTVLEHIPISSLNSILREGLRILNPQGVFVHNIDYSDHFSHSDFSISPINFLQYSNTVFSFLAGNRFMYMNRLRVDDFKSLFLDLNLDILAHKPVVSSMLLDQILSNNIPFKLHHDFYDKSPECLATLSSWFCLGNPSRSLHD